MAPLIGFSAALLLLLVMRMLLRNPQLYSAPNRDAPPPRGIRALLIFTCTAVSFSHGSNDGQKGMGLIMLILIGCAPTAYALNRTLPASETPAFVQSANAATAAFDARGGPDLTSDQARGVLTAALQQRQANSPAVYGALETLSRDLSGRVAGYGSLGAVPAEATHNVRNDMYLVLDASRIALKAPARRRPVQRRRAFPRSNPIRPSSRRARGSSRCG